MIKSWGISLLLSGLLFFNIACNNNDNNPETEPNPKPGPSRSFVFRVKEVQHNNDFTGLQPSAGASVTVFVGDESVVLITDEHGHAIFDTQEQGDIYYTVTKRKASLFYKGYLIAGVLVSEEDVKEEILIYVTGTLLDKRVPGNLQILDWNGDGQISQEDIIENEKLKANDEKINLVTIGTVEGN